MRINKIEQNRPSDVANNQPKNIHFGLNQKMKEGLYNVAERYVKKTILNWKSQINWIFLQKLLKQFRN